MISDSLTPHCTLFLNYFLLQNSEFSEKDITSLRNNVFANIVGVPFPFIGVDGSEACGNIYTADGKTKADCPLKAGTEYVYKNAIDVLEIYPRVSLLLRKFFFQSNSVLNWT